MSRNGTPHPNCVGVCNQYEAKKPDSGSRYGSGQKRCSMCLKFVMWEGNWCPCCRYRLRSKSRIGKLKEKYRNPIRL